MTHEYTLSIENRISFILTTWLHNAQLYKDEGDDKIDDGYQFYACEPQQCLEFSLACRTTKKCKEKKMSDLRAKHSPGIVNKISQLSCR